MSILEKNKEYLADELKNGLNKMEKNYSQPDFSENKLIDSDESLHEIALNLGFFAYSNFFNAFKKITKTTPEKYRLHHQKMK